MNKGKNTVLFYIAAIVCLIFLAVYIINDNPSVTPPAEYTYWEDESSELSSSKLCSSSSQEDLFSEISSNEESVNLEENQSNFVSSKETEKNTIVNINTASVDELCTLKGIGKVLAQRIIDYRNSKGCLTSIEQIMNVNGIAEKKFLVIKDNITV